MEESFLPSTAPPDAKISEQAVLARHRKRTAKAIKGLTLAAATDLQHQVREAKTIVGKGTSSMAVALSDDHICLVPLEPRPANADAEIKKHQALEKIGVKSPFLLKPIMVDKAMHKLSLRGKDLHAYLQDLYETGETLTVEEAWRISFQIFLGIQEMHRHKLALLDLKPENLVLMSEDPFFIRHIDLDFLLIEDIATRPTLRVSPAFLPPFVKNRTGDNITAYGWRVITAYPQVMDMYAFRLIVGEILMETEQPHPAWLTDIAKIPAYYKKPGCFDQNTLEIEYRQIKECLAQTAEDYENIYETIKNKFTMEAQEFLDTQTKGFYRTDKDGEGLTDPLESAPEDIRKFQVFYEKLRNQEDFFLGTVTPDSWQMLYSIIKSYNTVAQLATTKIASGDNPYNAALKNALSYLPLHTANPLLKEVIAIMIEAKPLIESLAKFNRKYSKRKPQHRRKDVEAAGQKLLSHIDALLKRIRELPPTSDLFERRCLEALYSLITPLKEYEFNLSEIIQDLAILVEPTESELQIDQAQIAALQGFFSKKTASLSAAISPEILEDHATLETDIYRDLMLLT